MHDNSSVDDMWKVIEKFGVSRKLLDPHNDLTPENVRDLYVEIKNRKPSTEGNRKSTKTTSK
jgi:hypothetical protein